MGNHMHLPSSSIKSDPYLLHLTNAERDLGWLWQLIATWLVLWIISCALIWVRFLEPSLISLEEVIAVIGLPLSILAIAVLLIMFVFKGAQLTLAEIQSEDLASFDLTNVTRHTVFWSLVLGNIYRARHWLTWVFGGLPYALWLMCQWYSIWALPSDLHCYTSLLGHVYCYWDGPVDLMRFLELFWFMSITIGGLGVSIFALLCCIGLTMKSKNVVLSANCVLAFILPLVLGIFLGTLEGFLFADTAYGNAAANASILRMLPAGIAFATLPFVASLGAQRFLRRWAFN